VLTAGNVFVKVTNAGVVGNAFPSLSSDPSGQWPGASGIEYLNFIVLAVGAVNPEATDPTAVRRVSAFTEWRPPTADPVDRIYRSFEGAPGGARLTNDDGDLDPATGRPRIDEEFLNGRDDDGDGLIDEDYSAVGQQQLTCEMRDDTPAALADVSNEKHVPLVLECRQSAWAYSLPGFQDFDAIEYTIFNRSGHRLDSLYVGFFVDMDAGPASSANYYVDDRDVPAFPGGQFRQTLDPADPLARGGCPTRTVSLHGFSVVDNDGDGGVTPGVGSLLLFGHTIDPLGLVAPPRVGFHSFRSFVRGTPYVSGGAPTTDHQRYELMSSGENVDSTGSVTAAAGDQPGDYAAWCSVGPFLQVPDGGSVTATIGFAVGPGSYLALRDYPSDYAAFQRGAITQQTIFERHPALANAFNAQVTYEGVYERPKAGFENQVPNCAGCETGLKLPAGSRLMLVTQSCPPAEPIVKVVTDNAYTWFDFDCDRCTGVSGFYLRHWNADAPPPNPLLNVAADYNYADRPGRLVAAGDSRVTLAWDNLSEVTPDPVTGVFDTRSYRVWRAAGWQRPPGSSGPSETDWEILRELRLFDQADSNYTRDPAADTLVCPRVFVPAHVYPAGDPHCADPAATPLPFGGCEDTATVSVCLARGDLWDRETGEVIVPDRSLDCARDSLGRCVQASGWDSRTGILVTRTRYPVGRYSIVDREVKNGFVYFYSVTAGDSLSNGRETYGRRVAVEADEVVPQAATRWSGVWVVPNPYRGFRAIGDRPSSWDLHPNSTDPTGTHVDFMGLPPGGWSIRIYTVAGDLVAELHSDDPVNAATRRPVTDSSGRRQGGVNRQQDSADDGEARWNLISRNGQDVVSGIYVYVVDSSFGRQRGTFVVIR
jgi:hypothetical protein